MVKLKIVASSLIVLMIIGMLFAIPTAEAQGPWYKGYTTTYFSGSHSIVVMMAMTNMALLGSNHVIETGAYDNLNTYNGAIFSIDATCGPCLKVFFEVVPGGTYLLSQSLVLGRQYRITLTINPGTHSLSVIDTVTGQSWSKSVSAPGSYITYMYYVFSSGYFATQYFKNSAWGWVDILNMPNIAYLNTYLVNPPSFAGSSLNYGNYYPQDVIVYWVKQS